MITALQVTTILIVIGGVTPLFGWAEIPNSFLTKHWTTENGLPQNSITAMVQTPDGYLWLGTFGGLVRFDGNTFTTFDTNNTPAFTSNRITALYVSRNGVLWIGTQTSEIYCLQGGKFQLFQRLRKSLHPSYIRFFFEDPTGNLFVGTHNNGFAFFRQGQANQYQHHDLTAVTESNTVRGICEDAQRNLWIASADKIMRYQLDAANPYTEISNFSRNEIVAIRPHSDAGLWIVTQKAIGLYQAGHWQALYQLPSAPFNDFTLTPGNHREVWYTNQSNVLYQLRARQVQRLNLPIETGYRTRALYEDFEGNVWMGVDGDGLYQLRRRPIEMFQHPKLPATAAHQTIFADHTNTIWIGTYDGLYQYKDNQMSRVLGTSKPNTGQGLNIMALFEDRQGTLWIGRQDGVDTYAQGKLRLNVIPGMKDVSAIFQDRKNTVWLGYAEGLMGIHGTEKKFIRVSDGLVNNDIRAIIEDKFGGLWIGTIGGLSYLSQGKIVNYTLKNGLSNEYVRDIYEDVDGNIWVATYGGGINVIRDGKITPITTKRGLFDDFVSRILIDERDHFWCLSNRGIFSVSRLSLLEIVQGKSEAVLCAGYGVTDGMAISEGQGGNQYSGWKMPNGKMWFLTIRGIAILTPAHFSLPPPQARIDRILVDGTVQENLQDVILTTNQDSLQVDYAGLYLTKPEHVQYRYKLAGFDSDWVTVGPRRAAFYTKLPPGDYTFYVNAGTPNAGWNTQLASVSIKVKPHFWQTYWFQLLLGLGALMLMFAVYRWRLAKWNRRAAKQEMFARKLIASQEAERQRIALELHDGLSQSLVIIKRRALVGTESSHDPELTQEQFQEIAEASHCALDEVREIIFALRPHQIDRMGVAAAISDLIERVATVHHWHVIKHIDELADTLTKDDENNLYRIVQEALNNISKHAAATDVSVEIKRHPQKVSVVIIDNGRGFNVQHVFPESPHGLGLQSMIERTKILSGQIEIHSRPQIGTIIQLQIPLKTSKL